MFKQVLSKLTGRSKPADTTQTAYTQTDRETLTEWAKEAVNVYLNNRVPFTAYTITMDVRSAHPGQDVPHPVMRDIVHNDLMAALVQVGLYHADREDYNGRLAVVYTPA